MVPTYLPFERPPDPQALWTAIPRGLRGGLVELEALDAKPISDQQTLNISLTLPSNFAYVFSECGLILNQNQADDWDDEYFINLQSYYQGSFLSMTWAYSFRLIMGSGTRANDAKSQNNPPRAPMWAPRGTSGIQFVMSTFNNNSAAATAGSVGAFVTFWEFDLEQVRKFPINAPIPTHPR